MRLRTLLGAALALAGCAVEYTQTDLVALKRPDRASFREARDVAVVMYPIPSPTFNLLFRYDGVTADVVHMDLYRIHDPEELKELGWDELVCGEEIMLVEWPERAGGLLPPDRWEVDIRAPDGAAGLREVTVRRVGSPPHLPAFPMALAPDRA